MIKLTDKIFVAGQIQPEDLAEYAEAGVKTVINNRPDGEDMMQPSGDAIKMAADILGMNYVAIPIAGGFSADQVQAFRSVLDAAGEPVLGFCRSGTRSTLLWCLSQAGHMETEDILQTARDAGYEFSAYAGMIESAKGA